MLRVIRQNINGLKYPFYSALTLSFASLGDAYLYPFLPQNADLLQVPVIWVGLLLSVNRFIRIAFNPFVIKLFAFYGVRAVTIIASVMAIVSTIGYGLGWGLLSLVLFRIVWGMAFAILRISTLAYAFEHAYVGLSLGVGKSIQEAGPLLALLLGPMLLSYFSATNSFLLLGLLSTPSLLYAINLPDLSYLPVPGKNVTLRLPSLFNSMTFIISFITEGVLVIVAGLFLLKNNESLTAWEITYLAAGYLAYRRICYILLSPIGGAIADRLGFARVFNFSAGMIVAGLVFLLVGWETIGLIVIFTFNSVSNTMAPGGASSKEADKIKAVSINATWRDVGAATGTLTGGFLLSGSFLYETFTIATFILAVFLIIYLRKTRVV